MAAQTLGYRNFNQNQANSASEVDFTRNHPKLSKIEHFDLFDRVIPLQTGRFRPQIVDFGSKSVRNQQKNVHPRNHHKGLHAILKTVHIMIISHEESIKE